MSRKKREEGKAPKGYKLNAKYEEALKDVSPEEADKIRAAYFGNSEAKVNSRFSQNVQLVHDEQLIARLESPLNELGDEAIASGLQAIAAVLGELKPEELIVAIYSMKGLSLAQIEAKTDIPKPSLQVVMDGIKAGHGRIGEVIYQNHRAVAARDAARRQQKEDFHTIEMALR